MKNPIANFSYLKLAQEWRRGSPPESLELRHLLRALDAPATTYNLSRLIDCLNYDESIQTFLADIDSFLPLETVDLLLLQKSLRDQQFRRGPLGAADVIEYLDLTWSPERVAAADVFVKSGLSDLIALKSLLISKP